MVPYLQVCNHTSERWEIPTKPYQPLCHLPSIALSWFQFLLKPSPDANRCMQDLLFSPFVPLSPCSLKQVVIYIVWFPNFLGAGFFVLFILLLVYFLSKHCRHLWLRLPDRSNNSCAGFQGRGIGRKFLFGSYSLPHKKINAKVSSEESASCIPLITHAALRILAERTILVPTLLLILPLTHHKWKESQLALIDRLPAQKGNKLCILLRVIGWLIWGIST